MQFIYRKKDNLYYRVHPFTMSFYVFALFLMALLHTHPLYLALLMAVAAGAVIQSGNGSTLRGNAPMAGMLVLMIAAINGLFVKAGATVLIAGPVLPVLGRVRITVEALAYGAGMGLRMLVILTVLWLFTCTVQPDRFMKLFGSRGGKTMLVLNLSLRLFPLMAADYRRIVEVQRCRGVRISAERWRDRVRNLFPIISVLLLSSLERSFIQAESMAARGYGSGKRTVMRKELWRRRDKILAAATALGLAASIFSAATGRGSYAYYPRMAPLAAGDLWPLVPMALGLLAPNILDWGWRRWPALQSRI